LPEESKAWVEVQFNYPCDTGDGGTLMWTDTVFDEQGNAAYNHACTNPEDRQVYRFTVKYPRTEYVAVDISQIKL
jgi:hypothetical protein